MCTQRQNSWVVAEKPEIGHVHLWRGVSRALAEQPGSSAHARGSGTAGRQPSSLRLAMRTCDGVSARHWPRSCGAAHAPVVAEHLGSTYACQWWWSSLRADMPTANTQNLLWACSCPAHAKETGEGVKGCCSHSRTHLAHLPLSTGLRASMMATSLMAA